jgi:hypothetical protein
MKRLDRNTSAFALNVSGLTIETPHREVALSDGDVASAWIQLGRRCLVIFGALASELPTDKLCPLRRGAGQALPGDCMYHKNLAAPVD